MIFLQKFNLETYLSKEVHLLLTIPVENTNESDLWSNKFSCLLNIDFLAEQVICLDLDQKICFLQSNFKLGKYLNLIRLNLIENFDSKSQANLFLQNDLIIFESCVESALKIGQIELAYLSGFAIFERCLGNVLFSLNGYNVSKIPFLLRDLVNDKLLIDFFGENLTNLIKLLVYTPKSLNLRNLCWHGFLNPDQFNQSFYTFFLL